MLIIKINGVESVVADLPELDKYKNWLPVTVNDLNLWKGMKNIEVIDYDNKRKAIAKHTLKNATMQEHRIYYEDVIFEDLKNAK
jgi:hypothetical protein